MIYRTYDAYEVPFVVLRQMYTREQISRTKHEFWITFGRYMHPVPSYDGMKVNWINYHTGIKDIHFRMEAGLNKAMIAVTIEHADILKQKFYFEKLLQQKRMLHEIMEEEWLWKANEQVEGKMISRAYKELPEVSLMNKDQWSDLISFFKLRMIRLDAFWENARWSIEQ